MVCSPEKKIMIVTKELALILLRIRSNGVATTGGNETKQRESVQAPTMTHDAQPQQVPPKQEIKHAAGPRLPQIQKI